jgi:hypothetical protein
MANCIRNGTKNSGVNRVASIRLREENSILVRVRDVRNEPPMFEMNPSKSARIAAASDV